MAHFGEGPQLAIPKAPRRRRPQREGDDPVYRRTIKQLPCCTCGAPPPSDPSHLKCGGGRGMALRAPDRLAVPQCRACHDELERAGSKNEVAWFAERGIDPLKLAGELWAAWCENPTLAALERVLRHHPFIEQGMRL